MSTKTINFKIDEADMSSVFEIMRSKLYSDPIGSICREVASNSRDANREAGNNDPIEISIDTDPNTSELSITFKDSGPGISTDRMQNVFCKYASSTKRESEHLTGGFGLGAKTPFAYTNKFYVITNVRKKKYYYTCSLDAGNGNITLTKEEKTTDKNGTEIIVPISNYNDVNIFESRVIYFTQFWTPRPIIKNFTHRNYPDINFVKDIGDDNVKIFNSDRTDANAYGDIMALVDDIPYKIDIWKTGIGNNNVLNGYTIVFPFKKADVSVSASRETLYFNETTTKVVKAQWDNGYKVLKQQLEDFLADGDIIDCSIKLNGVTANHYYDPDNAYGLYKEIFAMMTRHEDVSTKNFVTSHMKHSSGKELVKVLSLPAKGSLIEMNSNAKISKTEKEVTYSLDTKYLKKTIYWMDENRKSAEKNLTLCNENNGKFLLLTQQKPDKNNPQVFDKMFRSLKYLRKLGFTIVRYSIVEKTKIEREKKEKKEDGTEEITGKYLSMNSSNYYSKTLLVNVRFIADKKAKTLTTPDSHFTKFPSNIFALKVDKITDFKTSKAVQEKFHFYAHAMQHTKDCVILVMNEVNFNKFIKYKKVETNLDQIFYNDAITKLCRSYYMHIDKSKAMESFNNIFGGSSYYRTKDTIAPEKIQKLIEIFDIPEELKETVTNLASNVSAPSSFNSRHVEVVKKILEIRTDVTASNSVGEMSELKKHIDYVMKRKPLLETIGNYMDNDDMLEEIKKYSYACDVLFI